MDKEDVTLRQIHNVSAKMKKVIESQLDSFHEMFGYKIRKIDVEYNYGKAKVIFTITYRNGDDNVV